MTGSVIATIQNGGQGPTGMLARFGCVQKEVEEEKQARVDQVSDLLDWVKGLQQRSRGPNAESSLAAQQVPAKIAFVWKNKNKFSSL